jgi:hypothetical protein
MRMTVADLIVALHGQDPKLEVVMDVRWFNTDEQNIEQEYRMREPVMSLMVDNGPGGGAEHVLMLRNIERGD